MWKVPKKNGWSHLKIMKMKNKKRGLFAAPFYFMVIYN